MIFEHGVFMIALGLVVPIAALPSVVGMIKRDESQSYYTYYTTVFPSIELHTVTATFVQTNSQLITTTFSSPLSSATTTFAGCNWAQGESACFEMCCNSDQFCGGPGIGCVSNPASVPPAPQQPCGDLCGWDGLLCCPLGWSCTTNSNNQAECLPPSCGLLTTVYSLTSTYDSTVLETITLVVTRVETGTETIIRTASFQPTSSCAPELAQTQCGSICCAAGQFCQSSGVCALETACPPIRPASVSETLLTTTITLTATVPFETPISTAR
jgi:hypothetical protein